MHALRPVMPDDYDALTDLINRTNAADQVPLAMVRSEVVDLADGPHTDPATDGRVATVNDDIVGYTIVEHRPPGRDEQRAILMGMVDVDHRRQGIGTRLLTWGIERATERLRTGGRRLASFIRTETYEWEAAKLALLAHHGLEPVRYNHEMLRPLSHLPELEPTDGFEVIPFDRDRSDQARRSRNVAFEDHWGSTPVDEATWDGWLDEDVTRLDQSFLALDGDEVVGVLMSGHYPADEAIHGRREGWIESVSTIREWRGRGVASSLIGAACRAYAADGFTHAALGVDNENPTGAADLYGRLGFVTERRSIISQLQVPTPPGRGRAD